MREAREDAAGLVLFSLERLAPAVAETENSGVREMKRRRLWDAGRLRLGGERWSGIRRATMRGDME